MFVFSTQNYPTLLRHPQGCHLKVFQINLNGIRNILNSFRQYKITKLSTQSIHFFHTFHIYSWRTIVLISYSCLLQVASTASYTCILLHVDCAAQKRSNYVDVFRLSDKYLEYSYSSNIGNQWTSWTTA